MCHCFQLTEWLLPEVLIESFTASVIFMILPKEVGNFIAPVFSHEKKLLSVKL